MQLQQQQPARVAKVGHGGGRHGEDAEKPELAGGERVRARVEHVREPGGARLLEVGGGPPGKQGGAVEVDRRPAKWS
jgi:hypothetical protein